jgi:putative hydrolase of the HAD superfamily
LAFEPGRRGQYAQVVSVEAVIFDWGGTLTPWHSVDQVELWRVVCAPHFPADHHARAAELGTASDDLWRASETEQRSATIYQVFELAGIEPTEELLASYRRAWEPHTYTDPDARELLSYLRASQIRTGVLSNTMWPRRWHDDVFRRDGVLHLIDGAVYTSEIDRTKPHPDAFGAAMATIGVRDPRACVFVGDRPFDDIHGAKSLGMRAVLLPNDVVPSFAGAQPDAVISRLSELPKLIESWAT